MLKHVETPTSGMNSRGWGYELRQFTFGSGRVTRFLGGGKGGREGEKPHMSPQGLTEALSGPCPVFEVVPPGFTTSRSSGHDQHATDRNGSPT